MSYSADVLFQLISAGAPLRHVEDVAMILKAALPDHAATLQRAGFLSKFLVRTWEVMGRLGEKDPARDQLKKVFQEELLSLRSVLEECTTMMTVTEGEALRQRYLALDGEAFARLLDLLRDLSRIQNIHLDERS